MLHVDDRVVSVRMRLTAGADWQRTDICHMCLFISNKAEPQERNSLSPEGDGADSPHGEGWGVSAVSGANTHSGKYTLELLRDGLFITYYLVISRNFISD